MLRIPDRVRTTKIEQVAQESSNIRSLIFHDDFLLKATPGQFAMIWLPDIGEFPMSVSLSYGENTSIVVKGLGDGSRALYYIEPGQFIGIRGPYGNGFSVPQDCKNLLLVGGGTGIAPILKVAAEISKEESSKRDIHVIIGARTAKELSFVPFLEKILGRKNVHPTTDDGTGGSMGFAHQKVDSLISERSFDMLLCCGPEAMMHKVYDIAERNQLRSQFSLERIMKCGIAICGSCCIQDIVLCRDGPVLSGDVLKSLQNEFGKFERDKTGTLVKKT